MHNIAEGSRRMESETSFVGTRAKFKEVLLQYRLEWDGLDLRSKVEFLLSLPEIQDILRSRSKQKLYCKVRIVSLNFKSRNSTPKSQKHKSGKELITRLIYLYLCNLMSFRVFNISNYKLYKIK